MSKMQLSIDNEINVKAHDNVSKHNYYALLFTQQKRVYSQLPMFY